MERERLSERADPQRIDIGDPAVGRRLDSIHRIDCPRCRVRMLQVTNPNRPHVRYESCKVCYGVFLDAGEFRSLEEQTLAGFLRDLIQGRRS